MVRGHSEVPFYRRPVLVKWVVALIVIQLLDRTKHDKPLVHELANIDMLAIRFTSHQLFVEIRSVLHWLGKILTLSRFLPSSPVWPLFPLTPLVSTSTPQKNLQTLHNRLHLHIYHRIQKTQSLSRRINPQQLSGNTEKRNSHMSIWIVSRRVVPSVCVLFASRHDRYGLIMCRKNWQMSN